VTLRPLVRVVEVLVLVGTAVVTVAVIAEVLLRYSLNQSLIVTEELSRYGMIWVAMLGSVLVLREEGHVAAGGLGRLGVRGRRIARALTLLSLLFLRVLASAGIQTLPAQLDQQTLTLGVTIFWFYLALPVGALLMALVIVARMLGLDGDGPAPPPAQER
jgi:TRAP-type C4-dicarboxylate transport system permease small subunit